jgi:pantetheine-phosphate adenylyltransferase
VTERRIAVYGGSFDPLTLGHENVLGQAVKLFDEVHIIVASNPAKKAWIDASTRAFLCRQAIIAKNYEESQVRISVLPTSRNLYRYALEILNAQWAIRGIRGPRDLDDERDLRAANRAMTPEVTPVYLLADPEFAHISSSMVRGIIQSNLDNWEEEIEKFVSPLVAKFLRMNKGKS